MQSHPPRRHYPDFTDAENEAILRQVHCMRRRFAIASRGAGSNSMKRALWQEIANLINRNTSCPRSFTQVKQRHRAMRFEYNKYRLALLSATENGSSMNSQLPKWKPFMDILEELQPTQNSDEGDGDSLNGTDLMMDTHEELDKESSPAFPSSNFNSLDQLFGHNSTASTPSEDIKPSTFLDSHPIAEAPCSSINQLVAEKTAPEIIQVHSSSSASSTRMPNGDVKEKTSEELQKEIQVKQLEVLEQQHRNLRLEEQLLQARLAHFAKKSRLLNEALVRSLQDDDDDM